MDRFGYTKMQLRGLKDMDLLYPGTTYVHASHLLDDEWEHGQGLGWQRLAGAPDRAPDGAWLGAGAEGRAAGHPRRALVGRGDDRAVGPVHADALRCSASERGRRHQVGWDEDPTPTRADLITVRQVLRWATLDGAKVAGIADRTGSITPGKKADLVIIETKSPNVAPVIDPVAAVVLAADISNVDTVIIDGTVQKRGGKLVADLSGPRGRVEGSRDYLVSQVDPQPGWLPLSTGA